VGLAGLTAPYKQINHKFFFRRSLSAAPGLRSMGAAKSSPPQAPPVGHAELSSGSSGVASSSEAATASTASRTAAGSSSSSSSAAAPSAPPAGRLSASDSSAVTSPAAAAASADQLDPAAYRRKLARFDTKTFTLYEHCGGIAAQVKKCMQQHTTETDPVALDESGWQGVDKCLSLWEDYKLCGHRFYVSAARTQAKCAKKAQAFNRCQGGDAECSALELAAQRCAVASMTLGMSGQLPQPPDPGGRQPKT
jgi:hypothetical protein